MGQGRSGQELTLGHFLPTSGQLRGLLPPLVALIGLTLPAHCRAQEVIVRTFPDHIEVIGDDAGNAIAVKRATLGGILIAARDDSIELVDEEGRLGPTIRGRSCRWPRHIGESETQDNLASCPPRDEVRINGGIGSDTIRIHEGTPARVIADGGEDGDEIFGRGGGHGDRCYGGVESPSVQDTILNCGPGLTVRWKAINSPLSANPKEAGGLRIFPDQLGPDDVVNRRVVAVSAKLDFPVSGEQIHFKAFDVDDPTTDVAPVDPNGAVGNDNRPTGTSCCLAGQLNESVVETDINGVAETVLFLDTTMQPGNNFRVAASLDPGQLQSIPEVSPYRDPAPDTHDSVALTDLLTVWRRLHVERDTMIAVPPGSNMLAGHIDEVSPGALDTCLVAIDKRMGETDHYVKNNHDPPGKNDLVVGATKYPVVSNDSGTDLVVQATGGACPAAESAYELHDDDDDLLLPELPPMNWLQNSDLANSNILADAYVRPVVVADPNDDLPFEINSSFGENPFSSLWSKHDIASTRDYWAAYVISAFQGDTNGDLDPDTENCLCTATLGLTDITDSNSVIFLEPIRDSCAQINTAPDFGAVTAHEIGHQFQLPHIEGFGIMGRGSGLECGAGFMRPFFEPSSLAGIRDAQFPG